MGKTNPCQFFTCPFDIWSLPVATRNMFPGGQTWPKRYIVSELVAESLSNREVLEEDINVSVRMLCCWNETYLGNVCMEASFKAMLRQWSMRLNNFMIEQEYCRRLHDLSVYTKKLNDGSLVFLLLYVEIELIGLKSMRDIDELKSKLIGLKSMRDIDELKSKLGKVCHSFYN